MSILNLFPKLRLKFYLMMLSYIEFNDDNYNVAWEDEFTTSQFYTWQVRFAKHYKYNYKIKFNWYKLKECKQLFLHPKIKCYKYINKNLIPVFHNNAQRIWFFNECIKLIKS